jgi:hypothetical protein
LTASSRTYLLKLLRKAEGKLIAGGHTGESALVRQAASRLEGPGNIEDLLKEMYGAEGMDKLALTLMWLSGRSKASLNGLKDDLLEYHTDFIKQVLLGGKEEQDDNRLPRKNRKRSLGQALQRFSYSLVQLRRRLMTGGSFRGLDSDAVYQLLSETGSLQEVASASGNTDVTLFCESLTDFIQYAGANDLLADPRVPNFVESANVTLQTVVGGGVAVERDSLEQTIELLRNPACIFTRLPE